MRLGETELMLYDAKSWLLVEVHTIRERHCQKTALRPRYRLSQPMLIAHLHHPHGEKLPLGFPLLFCPLLTGSCSQLLLFWPLQGLGLDIGLV
jgi:hypothetical protein